MNKIDLNNRTAVVTGGVQGFGLAVVKRFIVSGAKVVIWDRDQKLLDDLNIDNTIKINIDISIGSKKFTTYTMDLTKRYIEINSDYRS